VTWITCSKYSAAHHTCVGVITFPRFTSPAGYVTYARVRSTTVISDTRTAEEQLQPQTGHPLSHTHTHTPHTEHVSNGYLGSYDGRSSDDISHHPFAHKLVCYCSHAASGAGGKVAIPSRGLSWKEEGVDSLGCSRQTCRAHSNSKVQKPRSCSQ
jgi:hypothetical protein